MKVVCGFIRDGGQHVTFTCDLPCMPGLGWVNVMDVNLPPELGVDECCRLNNSLTGQVKRGAPRANAA